LMLVFEFRWTDVSNFWPKNQRFDVTAKQSRRPLCPRSV